MSRIGNAPVTIPNNVKINIDNGTITTKGPLGTLSWLFPQIITVEMKGSQVIVKRSSDNTKEKALHGLTRSLIKNMVDGVHTGFEKTLLIEGVGYKAELVGKNVKLQIGYSHPVVVSPPEGITFEVPEATKIKVKGANKQVVGEIAAEIRRIRTADVYKRKGIRYIDEYIKTKVGKTGV
ncbi:MAG: 50S ribosomal protein L6 [bacterium]|nr:50S ribosomal protein L6 [bacterium]